MDHEYKTTALLRKIADGLGIRYTCGYVIGLDGRRIETESVTCLYPAGITVEEDEDGALWCEDSLDALQVLMIALVGDGKEHDHERSDH